MSNDKKRPTGDYPVGYCKPPESTRFKPGSGGNPGRRSRNPLRNSNDLYAMLATACLRRQRVSYRGKEVSMPVFAIIAEQLVAEIAKNPSRNLKHYLPLIIRAFDALPPEEGGSGPDYGAELSAKIEAMAERARALLKMQQSGEAGKHAEALVELEHPKLSD